MNNAIHSCSYEFINCLLRRDLVTGVNSSSSQLTLEVSSIQLYLYYSAASFTHASSRALSSRATFFFLSTFIPAQSQFCFDFRCYDRSAGVPTFECLTAAFHCVTYGATSTTTHSDPQAAATAKRAAAGARNNIVCDVDCPTSTSQQRHIYGRESEISVRKMLAHVELSFRLLYEERK